MNINMWFDRFGRWLSQGLRDRAEGVHRDQGGAVLVMVLAGILVALMATLVMYEAGSVSRDKIDSQMSADAAAYSASVVKARSMNMVAFANTNKRVIYSISTVYFSVYLSVVAATASYGKKCNPLPVSWPFCLKAAQGLLQLITEGVEMAVANIRGITKGLKRELKALNNYQEYLIEMAPWWAWMEGALRSTVNEGSFAMTWPPPGGPAAIMDKITKFLQGVDAIIGVINSLGGSLGGEGFSEGIPKHSKSLDVLPLTRRDDGKNILQLIGAGGGYYVGWFISPEHAAVQADVFRKGSKLGLSRDSKARNAQLGTLVPAGLISFGLLGKDMFDFRITGAKSLALLGNAFGGNSEPEDDWLQATSLMAFGYKGHKTRSSTDRDRLNIMGDKDWKGVSKVQTDMANGVVSVARSEIVYDQSDIASKFSAEMPIKIGKAISGFTATPGMWSPRWTARLRPVTLPDEEHGRTVDFGGDGEPVGLREMAIDTMPFMLLAVVMSLVDDSVDIPSLMEDAVNYWISSGGFSAENMEGIVK